MVLTSGPPSFNILGSTFGFISKGKGRRLKGNKGKGRRKGIGKNKLDGEDSETASDSDFEIVEGQMPSKTRTNERALIEDFLAKVTTDNYQLKHY